MNGNRKEVELSKNSIISEEVADNIESIEEGNSNEGMLVECSNVCEELLDKRSTNVSIGEIA